jgi:proteic killer suppression protein
MIESFADKNTARIWSGEQAKKPRREIQEDAREVLRILSQIRSHNDFHRMPHLRAHKLGGNRKNRWSLRVGDGWCITFYWSEETSTASQVLLEDYH